MLFGTDAKSDVFLDEIGLGVEVSSTTTFDDILNRYAQFQTLSFHTYAPYCHMGNQDSAFVIKYNQDGERIREDVHDDKIEFYIQHGANAGEDMLISYDCLSNEYLGIIETNVLTREDSSQAINDIQEAVKKVSTQRSQFGAYQNKDGVYLVLKAPCYVTLDIVVENMVKQIKDYLNIFESVEKGE